MSLNYIITMKKIDCSLKSLDSCDSQELDFLLGGVLIEAARKSQCRECNNYNFHVEKGGRMAF